MLIDDEAASEMNSICIRHELCAVGTDIRIHSPKTMVAMSNLYHQMYYNQSVNETKKTKTKVANQVSDTCN